MNLQLTSGYSARTSQPIPANRRAIRVTYMALTAIILLAFFLRVNKLALLPPAMSFDEATSPIDAYQISHSGSYPLYEDFGRPEPLYQILLAINTLILGPSIFAARLFSVFVGVLTIAAAYWAACMCLRDRPSGERRLAGLSAAAVLTVSLSHITLSRALYRGIPQPLFMLLYIGFFLRGLGQETPNSPISRRQIWDLILAGIFLASALYTYTAALAVPASVVAVGISVIIFNFRHWRKWLAKLVVLALTTGILLIPLGLRFLDRPQTVIGRATNVSSDDGITRVSFFSTLPNRLPALIRQFYEAGDPNPQYNSDGAPLVPPIFSVIFLFGLVGLLIRITHPSTALIISLLVVAALPVLATGEVPHGLRVMGEFAVFPLIVAVGIALVIRLLQSIPTQRLSIGFRFSLIGGLLALLTGVTAYHVHQQYESYFQKPLIANMYAEKLGLFEWFFRTDRYEFAHWLQSVGAQPILVPTDELNTPTTRAWLLTSYPTVTTADENFVIPSNVRIVVPWSLELNGLMIQTRNYALLQQSKITILPPLSQITHEKLEQTLTQPNATEEVETINFPDDDLDNHLNGHLMAKVIPSTQLGGITFEAKHPALIAFADQVQVTGWYGPDTLTNGTIQSTPFTLQWTAKRQLGHYYSSFLQLQTQDHQSLVGDDILIWRWLYPSSLWETVDKIPDTHILKIPEKLQPGAYRLEAGFYAYVDRRLPAFSADNQPVGDSATVGWLKVPQLAQPVLPVANRPGIWRIEATVADSIALREYSLNHDDSGHTKLSLYWQALKQRPAFDATIFVHVTDKNGKIIAQQDARPWGGQYPTFIWDEGEIIQTDYTLDIPTDKASDATITVGMYIFPGAVRLPIEQNGSAIPDAVIQLGKLNAISQ